MAHSYKRCNGLHTHRNIAGRRHQQEREKGALHVSEVGPSTLGHTHSGIQDLESCPGSHQPRTRYTETGANVSSYQQRLEK